MPEPVRTSDGDLVERVALFAAEDPAQPLQGGDVPGKPIRTGDGALVQRVAPYEVEDGVAVPVTQLGSNVGTDLTAEPPLQMTDDGDGKGTISIDTDVAGGVPTLDQNILLRLSQMPISGLNYHGAWNASTNTPALADGSGTGGDFYRVSVAGTQDLGSGPITFEVGDHVIYEGTTWQQLDPAQVIDWGDIQGTLANQADLQAALDAKADSADVPAGANPSAQVGLAATDGSAVTFLRSDAAPALDQSIAPTWTGVHEFQAGATFSAASTETAPTVGVASGNPQLDLQRTSAAVDQKRWNLVVDPASLELRALNDAGDTAANAWVVSRSGSTITAHSLLTGGAEAIGIAQSGEVTFAQALHMSEKNINNIADGANARDAVNKQQLDGKADQSALTTHEAATGAGAHLPTGGSSGQVLTRGTGTTAAWTAPPVTSVAGKTGVVTLAKADVGLGNVDNTADAAKPVSTAQQAAIDGKLATTGGAMTGPIAMGGEKVVNLGTPTDAGDAATKQYVDNAASGGGAAWGGITGTLADQTDLTSALNAKADQSALTAHTGDTSNPHSVTKAQVGLGDVDNTADVDKPVSNPTAIAISNVQSQLTDHVGTVGQAGVHLPDGGTTGQIPVKGSGDTVTWQDAAAGGAAAWGSITGTLADQTDLEQELGGRVLLTSKATETDARNGTDNDKWMTPLGTAQAIDEHQQTVPDSYSAFRTSNTATSDPTNFTDALVGPTPGTDENWQIDWVLYVSSPDGRIECELATQTGLSYITGGFGNLVGAGEGVVNSADTTSLIFKTDAPIRLLRLTSYVNAATTGTFLPVRLQFRSPDSVAVTVHQGSHLVATKLLTAT